MAGRLTIQMSDFDWLRNKKENTKDPFQWLTGKNIDFQERDRQTRERLRQQEEAERKRQEELKKQQEEQYRLAKEQAQQNFNNASQKLNSWDNTIQGNINARQNYTKAAAENEAYTLSDERNKLNDKLKSYGVDVDVYSFDENAFKQWANDHNFEFSKQAFNNGASEVDSWGSKKSGGILGIGGKNLATEKDIEIMPKLFELAKSNEALKNNKYNPEMTAGVAVNSFANGYGFGLPNKISKELDKKYRTTDSYKQETELVPHQRQISFEDYTNKNNSEHKIAATAGDIAGSLFGLKNVEKGVDSLFTNKGTAISKYVNAATKDSKFTSTAYGKGFNRLPEWVKNAAKTGITFSIQSGVNSFSNDNDVPTILKDAGRGFVGGAAGSSASTAVAKVGEKVLFNRELQHKLIPEIARSAMAGAAFAAGDTASTYFITPTNRRPTTEDVAKNVAVAFAFGALGTAINASEFTKQSKANAQTLYDNMASAYTEMAKNAIDTSGGSRQQAKINFAKSAYSTSVQLETFLTNKEYSFEGPYGNQTKIKGANARLIGADKQVQEMLADVRTIKEATAKVLKENNIDFMDIVSNAPKAENSASTNTIKVKQKDFTETTYTEPAANAKPQSINMQSENAVSNEPNPVTPQPKVINIDNAVAENPSTNNTADVIKTVPKNNVADIPNTSVQQNNINAVPPQTSAAAPVDVIKPTVVNEVKTYAPENASDSMKSLENSLIKKGASDLDRQNVILTATDTEKTLANSDKNIKQVSNGISVITDNVSSKMKNSTGGKPNYWNLFNANLKAVTNPQDIVSNDNFVREYASEFAAVLQANNSDTYNSIASDGKYAVDVISDYVMSGKLPDNAANNKNVVDTLDTFKGIVETATKQINKAHEQIYGVQNTDNTVTVQNVQPVTNAVQDNTVADGSIGITPVQPTANRTISLTKVGDFYEAYGDDAAELAGKLNLSPTTKNINGEKVQMVGFPTTALDNYKSRLGRGYDVTVINAVNNKETTDSTVHNNEGSTTLTDKCELIQTKHTKTCEDLWVIKLNDRISKEEYNKLKGKVKAVGGYYSPFAQTPEGRKIPGFIFKQEPTSDVISVFNDFFGTGSVDSSENTKSAVNKNISENGNAVLNNQSENDTISENNNEVKTDEIHASRNISENSNGFDKSKTEVKTGEILQRGDSLDNSSRRLSQIDRGRHTILEERNIREVADDVTFKKIAQFVVNEISNVKNKEFYEKYKYDSRWDEGYDFREMVTYDMLTDPQNELRELFADNIAEYFNKDIDVTTDTTGAKVSTDILKATKKSVVKNEHGQLIPVYHGTGAEFDTFAKGDIGIHFGSYPQAVQRTTDKNIENPKYIKAYLNIEHPLIINEDSFGWNAAQIAQKLSKMNILTADEAVEYVKNGKKDIASANNRLAETLKSKGFDGIIYNNEIEAVNGKSYIVFGNEQIFRLNETNSTQSLANYVKDKLSNNEKITSSELFKKATEIFGGTMANNAFTSKDAYDAMELGVNQYILSLKDISHKTMLEMLENLPTQTKRTEDMEKFQQFSTPPSIAYLANYAANVNNKDTMLEPSAGIGGIAVFAKRDRAKVIVNELDKRRLSVLKNMPFDEFHNENAEQIYNILGGDVHPTVIVMNPPFSSSSERNIKNTKIGAKHIEEALKILEPNGRLVAIVGNGMADNAPAFKSWWKDIKSKYDVKANININGKNYNKYGTNFDIQMLVIDKTGATTTTNTDHVDNLDDLYDILGGIRNERPILEYDKLSSTGTRDDSKRERGAISTTHQNVATRSRNNTQSEHNVSDTSRIENADNEQKLQSELGIDRNNRDLDSNDTGRTVDMADELATTDARGSGSDGIVDSSNDITKPNAEASRKTISENNNVPNLSEQTKSSQRENETDDITDRQSAQADTDTNSERNGEIANHRSDRVVKTKKKKLTDSIFENYKTEKLTVSGAKPHPAKVSESAAMAAVSLPKLTYKPSLPKNIIEDGILSDVQIEAVSYAGQAHSQRLPDGSVKGFFVGDGTGIGKGRTMAGIILDNYMQGRKKAVWISKNESLMHDAQRDVKALFGTPDLVHQLKGEKGLEKSLDFEDGILYSSYATLAKGVKNENGKNLEAVIKWLGDDFDGVIIFDESHLMKNSGLSVGKFGNAQASGIALMGLEIQQRLPNARFVYSSATGATEVDNLRYAERLGLWGDGTAFQDGNEFIAKIKNGGIAAMEVVASDMKNNGVYLSRNISYDDVRYGRIVHKLTKDQKNIYNELARAWQIVLDNINKAMEITNQDRSGESRRNAYGQFWSGQQRFFNQIITSMQVPSVIKDIEKQLADGKSCVIQLTSTNEAAQKREMERLQKEGLSLDEFDMTPKEILMNYVENSFPIQQYETVVDEEGRKKSVPQFDSKGNPVLNRDAVKAKEELLDKLGSLRMQSSAIDMIINHFGTDLVAEYTGRSKRIVETDNGLKEEAMGKAFKEADVNAFQNGNKRIMIFSQAGGTGKSYHADRTAKNQQQRVHYLLEAGWQADVAVQGFGRTHRSNQASAPIVKLVTTDLKGQNRFISTIARRLAQLGALTKGQSNAGSQGVFSAEDNLENSLSGTVLAEFYKKLSKNGVEGVSNGLKIIDKLGLKKKILDDYNNVIETAPDIRDISKFLNRILVLETDVQNRVFEAFYEDLKNATEEAIAAGTFSTGMENYKADGVQIKDIKTIQTNPETGAETHYVQLEAKHKITPITVSDLDITSKSFMGFFRNKINGGVCAIYKIGTKTDARGRVLDNYRYVNQVGRRTGAVLNLQNSWDKLTNEEGISAWNKKLESVPQYRIETVHLIKDNILAVWDKLPDDNVRIRRFLTDDGEMLVGRIVSDKIIDDVLRRFDVKRKSEQLKPSDIIKRIKNGDTIYLENDWKIKQSRVSNEQRIEIVGPSYNNLDQLKKLGVFTERIGYTTRFFVPSETNTESIISGIMGISPYVRTDSNIHYSLDRRNGDNRSKPNNTPKHTPEQLKIMKEYENAVDNTLLDFIKYAREHKNDNRTTVTLSEVSKKCANDIKELTGIDVTDFEHSIKVNTIRHIDDGHGINGETDHSMADDKDIARIQYVLDNYDDIELINDISKEFRDKNQKPAPMIKISKRIDGTYYVVEAVPDTKKHQLPIISAYKNKAVEQQALIMQKDNLSPQLHAHDVVADTASTERVSQIDNNVNSKNTQYSLKSDKNNKQDLGGNSKNDGKIKKPHEIVSYLSNVFDVPISVGNLQYGRADGQYKDFERSIRVSIANNLNLITHELGHLLDNKYGFSHSSNADEVLYFAEQNDPHFISLYTPEKRLGEAIAEFTREFLKNPKKVQKETPNFYNEFAAKLDNADAEKLKQASNYIQDYFNSDFRTRVEAATITKKEIKQLEKSSVQDRAREIYTKLVDDLAPINDVMNFVNKTTGFVHEGNNNAYEVALNTRNANTITNFLFDTGMVDSNGKIINDKSFKQCISDIKSKDIKDFDNYLILKHSVEWLEPSDGKVKRVFADDTLQDIERIQKEIAAYENEHPEFKKSAENLYEFQRDMLKYWLVETGGMSEELFDELQNKYPCYVPFKRYVGKKSYNGVKSTFANQHTPIARAKGSGASVISPLESIINNINNFVKFGVRNKTMQVLADYADNVEGFAQFIEEVPPDKIRHVIGITKQVDQLKDVMSGLNEPDFLELSEALDDIFGSSVSSYSPIVKAGKQIVTCMSGGKYRYFQVHDKPLYDAIANMTPKQIEGLENLSKMLNATNVLITQYNYLFGVKNPIRDFDTALKHSKAYNNLGEFTAAYFTAFWHVFTHSNEYKEYQAAGGGHMSRLSDSIDVVQKALNDIAIKDEGKAKRLAYAIFRHPVETLTRLNEITETIPRLAEYEGMKKQGKDNQKAIYEANDITTNFSRSGSIGRTINKVERFSNAQIQGLDKEFRTFSTGGTKSILRYLIRYLISAVLTTAFVEFWNRTVDKDGWDELAQYQKNNFYCIARGDGKFIKLPKAREAALLNTFMERCIDLAFGDKDAFYQFGEYFGDTILPSWLPLSSFISGTVDGGIEQGMEDALHEVFGSTIIGGIYDNAVNKDFKGTPIVPKSMEDIPPKQQTNSKTTWLGYWLGQKLNMSPLKADHLIDSYTGIIGKVNRALGTMDKSQIDLTLGIKNTFTTDSAYSTDVFNKIYDKRDKYGDKFTYNSTPQNACLYEKYASTASFITKSNRIIKSLPQEEQRAAKQKLLDDVKAINMSISDTDRAVVNSINGDVTDEYYITTLPSEILTYTKKGKSYSYTMTYDEYKEYVTDYINAVNQKRQEQISTNEYINADSSDKVDILKDAKSDAGKEVRKNYIDRLKAENKFKQVGE